MGQPLLYEVNTRCWLREVAERSGEPITLGNVPDIEVETWRGLGFTHIWLMGVWATGPRARERALADSQQQQVHSQGWAGCHEEDFGGSPYAIADYRVPAALGGEDGLKRFRQQLHNYGLRLLLDFVPNHLGLDHDWVGERPDLFVQSLSQVAGTFQWETVAGKRRLAHGKDPNFAPWNDTVQLDYRLPATHKAMTELLQAVAARCDGVRCDMAMLLLNEVFARTWRDHPRSSPGPATEFWASAIATIKNSYPDFLFLGEVYWGLEPRLQELGFDYTYDKALLDLLVARDARSVQRHLLEMPPKCLAASAHFFENHDEARIASRLKFAEHRAAALLILGLPGMRLLHDGQLAGAQVRTPVQLLRRLPEPRQAEIESMYHQLLTILPGTAVGQGKARLLRPRRPTPDNPSAENFVVIQWQASEAAFDLVVVNLAPDRSQCTVALEIPNIGVHSWSMADLLGQERHARAGSELQDHGLYFDLPPHGAQLFHFQPLPQ
jgi:hypothetical protein